MFIHQSMNSFFIHQCTDYKLNVVAFISEVLYVYYVIDNKEVVVSMETHQPHRLPFSITHQRSAANVRHVLINIFNAVSYTHLDVYKRQGLVYPPCFNLPVTLKMPVVPVYNLALDVVCIIVNFVSCTNVMGI